jgi:hypothetical protein
MWVFVSMSSKRDVMVMTFLFNKKAFYERVLKQTGRDLRETEVGALIKSIADHEPTILQRRKQMRGCGHLYVHHGKIKNQLHELFTAYTLGFYHSTISLCGTIAERICYDFVDFSEVVMNKKSLDSEAKAIFYELPFRHLLEFLVAQDVIREKHAKMLHEIYNRRNKHVHPKKEGDVYKDATWCLNTLSKVLEDVFSMSRFYDLRDGKYHVKPQFRHDIRDQNS